MMREDCRRFSLPQALNHYDLIEEESVNEDMEDEEEENKKAFSLPPSFSLSFISEWIN